ncbi:MAG: GGDEF domain-containing protein [Bryobacteraceae bacterium]
MISLKRHLDGFKSPDGLLVALKSSYGFALEAIAQDLPPISPQLGEESGRRIRALRDQFEREPTPEVLHANRPKLSMELRTFASNVQRIWQSKDEQFKEILGSLAGAASMLAAQSETNDGRLTGFTQNLEKLVELPDFCEMKKRLAAEVAALKAAVDEMHRTSQASVVQLRAEVRQLSEKLAEAEEIARTDRLTGLFNRRSGEQALESTVVHGRPFSIVIVDLNGFKAVNDRWGHQVGDMVLKQFAGRISSAVRSKDVVCRWGGDEFLILLPECTLSQATVRSRAFATLCEGEYRMEISGQPLRLHVAMSQGVGEWRTGESVAELVHRVDEAMYRAKGRTLHPVPPA